MRWTRDEVAELTLAAIKDNQLAFISDVPAFVPFSRELIYYYGLHKSPEVKRAIEINRIEKKRHLRERWFHSESPALQVAVYKLLATEDELRRLQMQSSSAAAAAAEAGRLTDRELALRLALLALRRGAAPDEILDAMARVPEISAAARDEVAGYLMGGAGAAGAASWDVGDADDDDADDGRAGK